MFGRKKRGFVSSVIRQMIRVPYRALVGEYKKVEPGTLILVRHGESDWNANKTFTGWAGKSALYSFNCCLCNPHILTFVIISLFRLR